MKTLAATITFEYILPEYVQATGFWNESVKMTQ